MIYMIVSWFVIMEAFKISPIWGIISAFLSIISYAVICQAEDASF
jgi:hypothetical protein